MSPANQRPVRRTCDAARNRMRTAARRRRAGGGSDTRHGTSGGSSRDVVLEDDADSPLGTTPGPGGGDSVSTTRVAETTPFASLTASAAAFAVAD
jgi:hypothetical protein